MKKYDLLKIIAITLVVVTLISWCVPAGIYVEGKYTAADGIIPIGLYDLFRLPVVSIVTFIQYGLLFLAIGGFYGVINKTGAYSKLIDNIVGKVKSESKFLVITTLLFALLTSLIGSINVLFILVPFFVALIIKLGYSKFVAFLSTIGAMLIGQIGTLFGFTTWGYIKYIFGVGMTELFLVRLILLIMILTLYVILVRKHSSNETLNSKKKKEKIEIPLYEQVDNDKTIMPLIVMAALTLCFLVVGTYNWFYAFEIQFFTNLYSSMVNYMVGGMPIFNNIIGNFSEIGFFGNYDVIVVLLISALITGWVYNLKLNDIIDGFKTGFKQMLAPALYAMLSCVVFTALLNMLNNYEADFVYTILNKLVGTQSFSLLGTTGISLIGSFAYNDFYTFASNLSNVFSGYSMAMIPVTTFLMQTMYSLIMVIAPTSVFLLAGLSYLEVPYKTWAKTIWKLLLIIFAVVVVLSFIITTMA